MVIAGIWIPEVSSPLPLSLSSSPPPLSSPARSPVFPLCAPPCAASAPTARPRSSLWCGPRPSPRRGPHPPPRQPRPPARGLRPRRRGSLSPCARPSRPRCAAPAFGNVDPQRGSRGLDAACAASRSPVYPMRSHVGSPTRAVIYFWFLINFKLCLVSVLRRALHRATNLFNFRFY
jgi:hypothetical protein